MAETAETLTFPILESSPAMKGEETRKRTHLSTDAMPFDQLEIGQSFRVPIEYSESSLRVRISRENKMNPKKRFAVINWGNCYEVGRVTVGSEVTSNEK